jgi:hypothetical protein
MRVGKKDLGNGYFEDVYETRPKYEDRLVDDVKITYEVDRWVRGRQLENETTDGREPEYPAFVGSMRERVGRRRNRIELTLVGASNQKQYTYVVDLISHPDLARQAATLVRGRMLTAEVNAVGSVTSIDELRDARSR